MITRLFGFRRILRENRDLKERIRALEAELHEERSEKYQLVLAMTDRTLTAAGCFALPKDVTQSKEKRNAKPAPTPEPSPILESYLESVRAEGVRLGKSQGEIDLMLGRLRRGESVIPEFEQEEFNLPS